MSEDYFFSYILLLKKIFFNLIRTLRMSLNPSGQSGSREQGEIYAVTTATLELRISRGLRR